MTDARRSVSIVVPTYKEAANLDELTHRIFAAVDREGLAAELIIVDDDSRDGTDEVVHALQSRYPIRLIVRRDARGLSSAVLHGLRHARFDRHVVLDADLQHPPEMIPSLVNALDQAGTEFAIATRYHARSRVDSDWSRVRRMISSAATLPARPLARLTDPMSGFFALERTVWERAKSANPVGYKIALELFVRARCCGAHEVPIQFAARRAGASKLGIGTIVAYMRQLIGLYRFRYPRATLLIPALFLLIAGYLAITLWFKNTGPDRREGVGNAGASQTHRPSYDGCPPTCSRGQVAAPEGTGSVLVSTTPHGASDPPQHCLYFFPLPQGQGSLRLVLPSERIVSAGGGSGS